MYDNVHDDDDDDADDDEDEMRTMKWRMKRWRMLL